VTLDRNNATGARDVYVKGLLAGTWTPDDSQWILHMQDDPTELLGLIKEANARPDVGAALKAMGDAEDAAAPPEPERPWLKQLYPGAETAEPDEQGDEAEPDGSDVTDDDRARTREAMGPAADDMSDEDIDRVVIAARGPSDSEDDEISDEDLDALAEADNEADDQWDLED